MVYLQSTIAKNKSLRQTGPRELVDLPHHSQLKEDINHCLDVWTQLLRATCPDLEYLYAKGSALKPWQSLIDYVPMISDVDLHLKLPSGRDLFDGTSQAVTTAADLATQYTTIFTESHPDHYHLPRPQLMVLTPERLQDFVPPLAKQITMLHGEPKLGNLPAPEVIRQVDRQHLQEDAAYMSRLPEMLVDRVGIEFWTIIRRLTYRVSPAPVRLLSQSSPDPAELWTWNRSRILEELQQQGFDAVAEPYFQFYKTGWQVYLDDFMDQELMLDMIIQGYQVITQALALLDPA